MTDSPTLGERVREAREAAGLSRSRLARRAGVSEPVIWNWERKGRKPRSGTLAKVADALGVTESFLRAGDFIKDADIGARAESVLPPPGQQKTLSEILEDTRTKVAQVTGLPMTNIRLHLEIRVGHAKNVPALSA